MINKDLEFKDIWWRQTMCPCFSDPKLRELTIGPVDLGVFSSTRNGMGDITALHQLWVTRLDLEWWEISKHITNIKHLAWNQRHDPFVTALKNYCICIFGQIHNLRHLMIKRVNKIWVTSFMEANIYISKSIWMYL